MMRYAFYFIFHWFLGRVLYFLKKAVDAVAHDSATFSMVT